MKLPWLMALLLVITLISGCIEYKRYEITAEDVLKDALEKCNSTSYEVTILSYILPKDENFENQGVKQKIGHGAFKGSNKFKIEDEEKIVVSNGSVMWIYWNATKHLIINDFSKSDEKPKGEFTKIFLDLLNNYDLNLRTTPNYYIINATSRINYPIKSKTVWIDKKTLMPLKVESKYELDELNLTYVTEYKDLKFREFNDSIFNVTPPKVKEFMRSFYFQKIEDAQKKVNFTIVEPSYTAGCKLKGVNVIEQRDKNAVVLLYRGKCLLFVFESPVPIYEIVKGERIDISGVQALYREWELGREVRFKLNSVVFEVMSDCLSKQKLIMVAKSIINQSSKPTNS
ncbi:hypothetical protein DRP05_07140 [Archaeoglobales archaeon]|nr:MAG: hypothetical protein DRP05_07140 [Archaeoglobales archaeon]